VNAAPTMGMHGASPQAPVAATGWRAGVDALDRWLGRLTEIPAAALVLANIAVLLAGVVSRYVFHSPLVWSDELAGIMFLWMSMLGAVVALRRGEHMRMTAFVAKASPRVRAFLDVLALAASLAFLLLTLIASFGSSDNNHSSSRCRRYRWPHAESVNEIGFTGHNLANRSYEIPQ